MLGDLVSELGFSYRGEYANGAVNGIAYDSRQVKPGFIFVALKGLHVDGHKYIPQAIKNGAVCIFGSKEISQLDVPYIQVKDTRETLAALSAAFYVYPARKLTVIGVTGTDGKTTTTNMIFKILKTAGYKVGMISTVNAVIGERVLDTGFHVTTPEAPDVQRYLHEMVEAGLTHVVLEATSHGLEQRRVAECQFDIGVVTNIQHEHLDFHQSYEAYQRAKGILFQSLGDTVEKQQGNYRLAVVNKDDQSYGFLNDLVTQAEKGKKKIRSVTYGIQSDAYVLAKDIHAQNDGIDFEISVDAEERQAHLNLMGEYNVYNALAAIATTVTGIGVDIDVALSGLGQLKKIPGRMERIDLGQPFQVIVDFAHTPNALKQALLSVRKLTKGRVIAVFGSAGLRDKEKRRMMAEIATELADISIFTAEDPRTESLEEILQMMADGANSRGGVENQDYFRIPDRGKAVSFAIRMAGNDDTVIICGKGHEQSMCFGEIEYPWDDVIAARAALAAFLKVEGPQMPKLPTSD